MPTTAAPPVPALLLACGNSLRQDDGVGLRIAEAAEQLLPASRLRIVAVQQFTPELAVELAAAELAIFVDASAADEPGSIRVARVVASDDPELHPTEPHRLETHTLDPAGLMALARFLCGHAPQHAFALTVGAARFGHGEELSRPLRQAVPRAVRLLNNLVTAFAKGN